MPPTKGLVQGSRLHHISTGTSGQPTQPTQLMGQHKMKPV